jgi:hypothetical protein
MTIDRSTLSPALILEKYIAPRIAYEPNTGCWLWLGYVQSRGYATTRLPHPNKAGWSTQYVARFMYEYSVGPISDAQVIKNQCKVHGCVNPDHHCPIARQEWLRNRTRWKHLANRTKCSHGHPFTEETTFVNSRGKRRCRACQTAHEKKSLEKRRGEHWRRFGEYLESIEPSERTAPKKYYVYHLIDPFTERVFYVGKGCGGRIFHHERDLLGGVYGNSKKEAVIRAIWNNGGEIQFSIVERHLTEARALWLEQAEIHRIGIENLTNRASGSIPHKCRFMTVKAEPSAA